MTHVWGCFESTLGSVGVLVTFPERCFVWSGTTEEKDHSDMLSNLCLETVSAEPPPHNIAIVIVTFYTVVSFRR